MFKASTIRNSKMCINWINKQMPYIRTMEQYSATKGKKYRHMLQYG